MQYINAVKDPIANLLGDWSAQLGLGSVFFRIALAFVLAGFIGLERANKRHSAGMRTFIIVTFASTSAMLLDLFFASNWQVSFPIISAATVIGIGSISTYSILYSSKNQIKGLTTAVALWACCIIGLSIGCGFYTVCLISSIALIFCLSLLPTMENYLKDKSNHFEIHLELTDKRTLPNFVTTARNLGLTIDDMESNPAYLNSGLSVFSISLTIASDELKAYKKHTEIIEALSSLEYVSYIEEIA